MSENNEHHDEQGHDGGHHVNYFRIYVTLLILFLISVVGPEVGELTGLRWITLITAFGIAFVKARLVVNNFMHLAWERRIAKWLLASSLILLLLFVAGVAPDVMNHEGNNWENVAAKQAVERGLAAASGYSEEEAESDGPAEEVIAAGFSAQNSYGQICATCHGSGGEGDGVLFIKLLFTRVRSPGPTPLAVNTNSTATQETGGDATPSESCTCPRAYTSV